MVVKKQQYVSIVISIILGVLLGVLPSDLSQTDKVSAQNEPTVQCSVLEDTNAQKNKIITVLEESIGNEPQTFEDSSAQVINCMRVTTCKEVEEPKPDSTKPSNVTPDPNSPNPSDGTSNPDSTEKETKTECSSKYQDIGACPADAICQRVQVFIAQSGTDLLFGYLGTIYRWLAGMIGIVCVLYIIWGGIMIAVAGDNSQQIDEQKTKILQSIAGLVILFLASVILATINPNFFKLF